MLEKMSDEELIQVIRTGSQEEAREATEVLMVRYKDFVRTRTHSFFLIGADRDDVIQEGMIGLYKAVISFDPEKDSSFRTFADICVRRQIMTAVKLSGRMKHYPLNSSISLNVALKEEGDDQELTLMDQLASTSIVNPEGIYVSREEKKRIEQRIIEKLSPLERQVLDLYISGLGYQQIARVLDRTPKSIDNALQRARNKTLEIVQGSE